MTPVRCSCARSSWRGSHPSGSAEAETATAERAARRLVDLAPLRESGTRLLMEVLAGQGNRADALLVYDALRVQLHEELGVAPSEATQTAHRMLLG